jgi:hypothetical protein
MTEIVKVKKKLKKINLLVLLGSLRKRNKVTKNSTVCDIWFNITAGREGWWGKSNNAST